MEKYSGGIFFGKEMVSGNKKRGQKNQLNFVNKICNIKKK